MYRINCYRTTLFRQLMLTDMCNLQYSSCQTLTPDSITFSDLGIRLPAVSIVIMQFLLYNRISALTTQKSSLIGQVSCHHVYCHMAQLILGPKLCWTDKRKWIRSVIPSLYDGRLHQWQHQIRSGRSFVHFTLVETGQPRDLTYICWSCQINLDQPNKIGDILRAHTPTKTPSWTAVQNPFVNQQ